MRHKHSWARGNEQRLCLAEWPNVYLKRGHTDRTVISAYGSYSRKEVNKQLARELCRSDNSVFRGATTFAYTNDFCAHDRTCAAPHDISTPHQKSRNSYNSGSETEQTLLLTIEKHDSKESKSCDGLAVSVSSKLATKPPTRVRTSA